MINIYQIGNGGYLGNTLEIEDNEGAPAGYTRTAPPSITDGQYVVWQGSYWGIVDVPYSPPAINTMPTLSDYEAAVQNMLDTKVKEYLYDSMLSMTSYDNSTKPRFKAEALAGIQWRDDCWDTCWSIMTQVQGGQIPQPTIDELVAMMPTFTWPV